MKKPFLARFEDALELPLQLTLGSRGEALRVCDRREAT